MSTEEIERLHMQIFEEIINRHKLDLVDQLLAADYVSHSLASGFPPGREGFKAFIRIFRAAFPDAWVTVDHLSASGHESVARITFRGTQMAQFRGFAPLGQAIVIHTVDIAHFANGQCVAQWGGLNMLNLSQQIGVAQPLADPAMGVHFRTPPHFRRYVQTRIS
jgi:predicted ester cyclase